MERSFYVTTRELDKPNREHTYRLPVGENLPEGEVLKVQRPAGLFKFGENLSPANRAALALLANSL